MPKFRTKTQNSKMFGIAAKLGLTHDDLKDMAFDVSNERTDKTSELHIDEADKIIVRLESYAEQKKDVSPRTINYRRAKTGVVNIDTAKQKKLLHDLWFSLPHRTQNGLDSICLRTIKTDQPRTTKQFNKIIEAVKSMNSRTGKCVLTNTDQKEAA